VPTKKKFGEQVRGLQRHIQLRDETLSPPRTNLSWVLRPVEAPDMLVSHGERLKGVIYP
jgi:hypothetical protein